MSSRFLFFYHLPFICSSGFPLNLNEIQEASTPGTRYPPALRHKPGQPGGISRSAALRLFRLTVLKCRNKNR
jgi:hypothetical protein